MLSEKANSSNNNLFASNAIMASWTYFDGKNNSSEKTYLTMLKGNPYLWLMAMCNTKSCFTSHWGPSAALHCGEFSDEVLLSTFRCFLRPNTLMAVLSFLPPDRLINHKTALRFEMSHWWYFRIGFANHALALVQENFSQRKNRRFSEF